MRDEALHLIKPIIPPLGSFSVDEMPMSRCFAEKEDMVKEHPLKNPDSKHYELWEGYESIEALEAIMTKEELIGWCKGNILKYRLRIGKKDDPRAEVRKIITYEKYLKQLMEMSDEMQ